MRKISFARTVPLNGHARWGSKPKGRAGMEGSCQAHLANEGTGDVNGVAGPEEAPLPVSLSSSRRSTIYMGGLG